MNYVNSKRLSFHFGACAIALYMQIGRCNGKNFKAFKFPFFKKKTPASYMYFCILLLKYSQPNKTLNLIIKSIIDLIIHGTTKERKQTLRKLNLCISKVKLRKSVVAFKVFSPPLDIPSIGSDLRRKRADFWAI